MSGARIERSRFQEIAPDVVSALARLDQATAGSGLDAGLLELVRLRTSQINGCVFCIQYHLIEARRLGVPGQKLDLAVAWEEADIFTPRERAALAWTEALTEIAGIGISDEDFEEVRDAFSEAELAHLTAAIGTINMWNRISVAFRYDPPGPTAV